MTFGLLFLAVVSATPPVQPPFSATNPPPPVQLVVTPEPVLPPAPPQLRANLPYQKPRPILPPGAYFIAEDYPPSAIALRHEGTVAVGMTVAPDGRVMKCVVLRSSGWTELDSATCTLLARRATFYPATDGQAKPTMGWFKWPPVTWRLPPDPVPPPEASAPAVPEGR